MMSLYYVKKPLFGVAAGRVERFAAHRAGTLLLDGSIEAYDEKNKRHREAPGSPESDERARREAATRTEKLRKDQEELHRRQFGLQRA